jgi:AraC-like DNA-binding protein
LAGHQTPLDMSKNTVTYTLSLIDNEPLSPMKATVSCFAENPDAQHYLPVTQHESFLGIYLNLWDGLDYHIEGMQDDLMMRGSFNIIHLPENTPVVYLLKKGNYRTLTIHFSIEFLNVWRNNFPFLNSFLDNLNITRPTFLCPHHLSTTTEMDTIILNILYNCDTGVARQINLRARIYDILGACLREVGSGINRSTATKETIKIQQVHDYILLHVQHHCDLNLLATMVDMDKRKLTAAFKQMYKITILTFWMDERMKKAVSLLENTDWTIKEIAKSIGYRTQSNFTDIFKNKFGYPPTAIRTLDHTVEKTKKSKRISV